MEKVGYAKHGLYFMSIFDKGDRNLDHQQFEEELLMFQNHILYLEDSITIDGIKDMQKEVQTCVSISKINGKTGKINNFYDETKAAATTGKEDSSDKKTELMEVE